MFATNCQRCSNIRTIVASILSFGTLAYTLPIMMAGQETPLITIGFILAFCSVPPVVYNGIVLISDVIRMGAKKIRLASH